MDTRILALGGSLRENSRTVSALEAALRGAQQAGAYTELLDLRELNLPMFDDRPDTDTYPAGVWTLLDKVAAADGLIIASPVYHGTLSGAVKNMLDFLGLLERGRLEGKVAGLIAVAGGGHGINTLNTLEYVCRSLRLWTVPTTVAIPGAAYSGTLISDTRISQRLGDAGRQVARYAEMFARERADKLVRIA